MMSEFAKCGTLAQRGSWYVITVMLRITLFFFFFFF